MGHDNMLISEYPSAGTSKETLDVMNSNSSGFAMDQHSSQRLLGWGAIINAAPVKVPAT